MAALCLVQKLFRGYAGRGKVKVILVHRIHSDLKRLACGGLLKTVLDIDCLSDYHSQLLLQSLVTLVSTTDNRLYKTLPTIAELKEYRQRLTALINIKENHDFITKAEYKRVYEERKCMVNEDKRSLLIMKCIKMKEKILVETRKKEKQKQELEANEEKRRLKRKATQNIMYYLSDEQSHEKQERELMFGEETKARKYYSFLQSSGNAKYLLDCELMRQEDLAARILRSVDLEKKEESELLKSSVLKVNKLLNKGNSPKGNLAYWRRVELVVPRSDLVNSSIRLIAADKQKHYTCSHFTLSQSQQNKRPILMEFSNSKSIIKFNLEKFIRRELIHTLLAARHCRLLAYHSMSLALGAFKTHYSCLIALRSSLYSDKISTRQKRKEYIAAAVKHEAALVSNRQELIVSGDVLYDMMKLEVQLFTDIFSKNRPLESPEVVDIMNYKSKVGYGRDASPLKDKKKPGEYIYTSNGFWSVHRSFNGSYPPPPPSRKAKHTPTDRGYAEDHVKVVNAVDDSSVTSDGNTTVVSDSSVSSTNTNDRSSKRNRKKDRKGAKRISRDERSRMVKEAMQKAMETLAIKERKHFDVPGFRVFLSKSTEVTQFDFIVWANEITSWMKLMNDWFSVTEQKWKLSNKTAIISSIQRLKYLTNMYTLGVIDTEDIESLLLYSDSSPLHLHELLMYTLDVEVKYELSNAANSNYSCVLGSSFLDKYYGKHPGSCLAKYLMDDYTQLFYSSTCGVEDINILDMRNQLVQNKLFISLKQADLEEINKKKSLKLSFSTVPLPSLARYLSLTSGGYGIEKDEIMSMLHHASVHNTFCTVDLTINDGSSTPLLLLAHGCHQKHSIRSIQVHRVNSETVDFQIPSWCFPVFKWSSRLDRVEYHRTHAARDGRKELVCDKYGRILLLKLKLRVFLRRTLCCAVGRKIERDMMAHEDALAHATNGRLVIGPNRKKGILHNFTMLLLSKQRRARIAVIDEYMHILTKCPWPSQRVDYSGIYRMSLDMLAYQQSKFMIDLPDMQGSRTTLDINTLADELHRLFEQRGKCHDWVTKEKSPFKPMLSDVTVAGGIATTIALVKAFEHVDKSSIVVQVPKIEIYNDASGEDQVMIDARLGFLLSRRLCDNTKNKFATKCVVNKHSRGHSRGLCDQAYSTIYCRNPAKYRDKVVAMATLMDMKILFWKRFRQVRWGKASVSEKNIVTIQSIWRRNIVRNRFHRAKHMKQNRI